MKFQLALPKSRIADVIGNVLVILLYLNFAVVFITSYIEKHNVSVLLYAIYNTVIFFLLFIRKRPRTTSDNFWYWMAAMGGTFADLLARPYPLTTGLSYWLIPQCIGTLISLAGVLSLNRGFGIVVANRGIHTNGMYRFIRHPLYAGYALSIFSFLIQHVSLWNLTVFIVALVLQVIRIRIEERFLASDPAYVKYTRNTKWRLLPGIW